MADLIDRKELLQKIWEQGQEYSIPYSQTSYAEVMVGVAPTVDAAPVVHGKWEFPIFTDNDDGLDPRVKCSECGGVEAAFARWKYCPNCGAKMDGGNEKNNG